MAKRERGRPQHVPTDDQRKIAELAAAVGIPHHEIGPLIGVSIKTLLKYYRRELKLGKTKATVTVGGRLYKMTETNAAAAIFWMKSQAGWREKHVVEHANADGKPLAHAMVTAAADDEDAMKAYLAMITKDSEGDE